MSMKSYGFERYLLESELSDLYKAIKEYSVWTLHLPMTDTKSYVGFGKYKGFFMFFIGRRNDDYIFSSRIKYSKVADESNIIRLPFTEQNRNRIFECIDKIYKDFLESDDLELGERDSSLPEISINPQGVAPKKIKEDIDVVLATPIEKLVPQMIAFNNIALMENVDNYLKKYEGIKYDDTAIAVAKNDRKRLNSLSRKVNDERLRIAKIYKAPYDRFKQQVDEVIDRIKQVSAKVDAQIKEYENEERKIKKGKIEAYFNDVFAELTNLVPYESIHKEKWLNSSEKLTDIFAEIKSIFIQIKSDILQIEAMKFDDEDLIKAYYFRTLDIDSALADAERDRQARQAVEEFNAKHWQPPMPQQTESLNTPPTQSTEAQAVESPCDVQLSVLHSDSIGAESGRLRTVTLNVKGTDEQLFNLNKYLSASGLAFEILESIETQAKCVGKQKAVCEQNSIKTRASNILKRLYGDSAEFRNGQYEAIEATLTKRRTLIVQKTGWGKSMVYFTATKILRDEGRGTTVVVSPLLSLMENQMEAAINLNLRCAAFNSNLKKERRVAALADLQSDKYDLIFVTPETLFSKDVNEALKKTRIGLFVIDEAHCISDWGNDFRLDYSNLHKIIGAMSSDVPVLATTATANNRVIEDIKKQFGNDVYVSRGPLTRESLAIQVIKLQSKVDRYAWILDNINKLPGSGIIYCLTHNDCIQLSEFLVQNGINAMPYYSGKDDVESVNTVALEKFKNNQLKVIVATVKLGMGYDKGDIGFVIHYQMPPNIVSYYQQIGRAGRNINKAYAILMCGEEDDDIHEYFMNEAFPTRDECYKIVSIVEKSGGANLNEIERMANISHKRIEKAVAFLVHEEALYREGSKYYLTPKKFIYNDRHYVEITEQRKKEYAQMKELVQLKTCYSKFVANCLDDLTAHECGNCANCIGKPLISDGTNEAGRGKATDYLENFTLKIEPLVKWEDDTATGHTNIDMRNEVGICLSKYNDGEYGSLVRQGKYGKSGFDNRLIARSVKVLKPILAENGIRHICCVPSLRSDLVKNFTVKLAQSLGVEFVDCLIKCSAEPQKSMQNSAFQCRNAWSSFAVSECEIPDKIILVDDIVDSKWTMTVCGYKLMQKGAKFVFPFALADSSRR